MLSGRLLLAPYRRRERLERAFIHLGGLLDPRLTIHLGPSLEGLKVTRIDHPNPSRDLGGLLRVPLRNELLGLLQPLLHKLGRKGLTLGRLSSKQGTQRRFDSCCCPCSCRLLRVSGSC